MILAVKRVEKKKWFSICDCEREMPICHNKVVREDRSKRWFLESTFCIFFFLYFCYVNNTITAVASRLALGFCVSINFSVVVRKLLKRWIFVCVTINTPKRNDTHVSGLWSRPHICTSTFRCSCSLVFAILFASYPKQTLRNIRCCWL